mgnify:CR=1 FL=1
MTYEELQAAFQSDFPLDNNQINQFRGYCKLLQAWNEKMNLTAIKEESKVIEKHFYDCLIPAKSPYFKGNTILDVGSGAGFPGMVFAIAFPKKKIVLVDATAKKCGFLNEVAKELGLQNVMVINKRAEDLNDRDHFDLVTARAVAPLPVLLEITAPFAKVHGIVLAMKGDKGEEELAKSHRAISLLDLHLLENNIAELPDGQGKRVNIFFEKGAKTAKRFPRSWGDIHSKPL